MPKTPKGNIDRFIQDKPLIPLAPDEVLEERTVEEILAGVPPKIVKEK